MRNFDDILSEVGGFGRYQKILCFALIPLTNGVCALVYISQLIVLSTPPFECSGNEASNVTAGSTCSGNCSFSYDTLFPTLSSENEWVCTESWRPYSIIVAFWLGNMIGAWLLGVVSDKYGRRPVIWICCFVYGVFGVMSAFFTNYYAFLVTRIAVGTVHHTLAHLPFVLVIEFCDASHRTMPLLTIMASYSIFSVIAAFLAYLLWSWEILVIVTAAPALIILLAYRLLPESPSWQISQSKLDEASATLYKIAKINKKKLSKDDVSKMVAEISLAENKEVENLELLENGTKDRTGDEQLPGEQKTKSTSIYSVIEYPNLFKQIISIMAIWIISYMCYYGHTQNTSHLGSNILISYSLGALVEIPAWSAPWLIQKYGRKPPLTIASVLAGLAGILYTITTHFDKRVAFAIALTGRMFITITYYVSLQFGPEIFPTVIRGQGVAMAETLGGIAILISPFIVYLEEIMHGLPLLVFGILGFILAFLVMFLPETKGKPLPSTLEESEIIGQK